MLEIADLKFLIFAHHKCLLDGIELQCKKAKVCLYSEAPHIPQCT